MKKVLLIDDEEDIIDLLTYHLDKNNYRVLSVSNPENALRMVKVENPDFIIINNLPHFGNKAHFCQKLAPIIDSSFTSIICLESDRQLSQKLQHCSDACLNIPLNPSVLIQQLAHLATVKGMTSPSS